MANMPEMNEYALIKDGETVSEFRKHGTAPVYEQDAKPWVWLPVSRVVGTPAGTIVDMDGGSVTVTTEPPAARVPRKVGSFLEFMDILPDTVQLAIDQAAVPGSELSLLLKRAMATNEVDLTSDVLLGALDMMVADSLITVGMKTEILEWDFNA